ncbi:MAG: hypothetical protein COB46_01840 [Rhodospirillaceae bacterium]|nr:MAG: hypothetical protein COB46_01840 [Rhodospirillaceae bacterium]
MSDFRGVAQYFLPPKLRVSLAALWIYTAIVSAFLFPQDQSFDLLSSVGIQGAFAPLFLYGVALVDLLLGVALLA